MNLYIPYLKCRFRFLYHTKFKSDMRRLKVIYACCVLHNMCSVRDVELFDPPPNENHAHNIELEFHGQQLPSGLAARDELCAQLYNNF